MAPNLDQLEADIKAAYANGYVPISGRYFGSRDRKCCCPLGAVWLNSGHEVFEEDCLENVERLWGWLEEKCGLTEDQCLDFTATADTGYPTDNNPVKQLAEKMRKKYLINPEPTAD